MSHLLRNIRKSHPCLPRFQCKHVLQRSSNFQKHSCPMNRAHCRPVLSVPPIPYVPNSPLLRHWFRYFDFVLSHGDLLLFSDLLLRTFDLVALVAACDYSQHLMYIITTMGSICTLGSCASLSFLQQQNLKSRKLMDMECRFVAQFSAPHAKTTS